MKQSGNGPVKAPGNPTILDPGDKSRVDNHRLSVTVSHELFEGDALSPGEYRPRPTPVEA